MGTTYLVTGGAGFIGSHLVWRLLDSGDADVVVLDLLTLAGSMENLAGATAHPRFHFVHGDIGDRALVRGILEKHRPRVVFNLAAETHVDRSIDGPAAFVRSNAVGAFELLEASRGFWMSLDSQDRARFRFVQVSTDEVFGSLGQHGAFTETGHYAPNSPYSASKAAADHFARAWFQTFGVPVLVTNCSNNYGPRQFPEKLIPLVILNALEGKPLPVYGDGKNIRDWLFVEDHCEALTLVARHGEPGQSYLIGAGNELTTMQVVEAVCAQLELLLPPASNPAIAGRVSAYRDLVTLVADRPGHDRRYCIDASKLRALCGWKPRTQFDQGIAATVQWYLANQPWCDHITGRVYARERLGLPGTRP